MLGLRETTSLASEQSLSKLDSQGLDVQSNFLDLPYLCTVAYGDMRGR